MNKKLILIIAMLLILLSSSVSAWEWDNVKEFEKGDLEYGKITVTNALGLGSDLAEYTLLENTDSCLVNCYAIGETILYDDGVLFNKFEFKNKENNIVNLNSNEIYIAVTEEYIENIKEYETECKKVVYNNGSEGKECESVLKNSYDETKYKTSWESYKNTELKAGTYTWKLEGNKAPTENIDWIGESLGVTFDEWAWWNGDYEHYKQLTITPIDYNIVNGTTINLTIDTATLIGDAKMQNDCDDLRVVYKDTTEIHRVLGDYDILTDDGCNDVSTNIFFMTMANMTSVNTDYKIYYNDDSASNPPNKADYVFLAYENCSSVADWSAGVITTDGTTCTGHDGIDWAVKVLYGENRTLESYRLIFKESDMTSDGMFISVGDHAEKDTWDATLASGYVYHANHGTSTMGVLLDGGSTWVKREAGVQNNAGLIVFQRYKGGNWRGWFDGVEQLWDTTNITNDARLRAGYVAYAYIGSGNDDWTSMIVMSEPSVLPTLVLGAEVSVNQNPFFIRYDINSTRPTYNITTDDLIGWYNVQDNESTTLYCDIHWLKDNIIQFSFIGESSTNNTEYEITLESENTTVGDAWRYELNCSDGGVENWVNSSEVVILDVILSIVQSIPENNLFTQSTSIAFECNATIDAGSGFEIDNITLITMNTDGTINTTYFEDVSGADISQDWSETLEEAEYNWSCKASSDNGHEVYTGNRTLTIDSTAPIIYIAQGLNDSVIYSLPINISWYFNVSDANLDTCWYSTNEEPTNLSVTCNYNISTAFAIGGESNITYCVNDSIGFEECLFSSFTIYHITTNLTESADPVSEGQGLTLTLYLNMTNIPSTTSASLIWNGANYGNGSKSITTNGYKFSNTFAVPDGVGSSTGASIDYNWSYHIPGFIQYNFTADTTTVYESNIGLCGDGYNVTILNYTMFDETTRLYDLVNGTIEQDTYLYSLENTSLVWHHYNSFTNTSNATICVPDGMINNSNFKLETTTRYWADGHVKEYHYLQNYNQSNYNNPKQINLYSLSESVATPYLVIYQDEYYLATEGAIIQPYRYYVGDGEYIAVEGGLTDDSGQTVLNLVSNEVTYRFYVRKDGELLFISSEYLAVCTDPLLMCQINLQETTNIEELINFSVPDNLAYVFDFDEDERTISFEFSTIDGTDTAINYSVILLDNYMNDTVCNEEVMSSGQTLTCVIPQTYKNTTYKVNINHDGDFMGNYYVSLSPESFTTFGYTGVFLGALAYMMIVLMATTSGVIAVVMGIVGLIFISLLGIFSGGSIIGLGSTILWFMVAGVIIIFKISGRRVN